MAWQDYYKKNLPPDAFERLTAFMALAGRLRESRYLKGADQNGLEMLFEAGKTGMAAASGHGDAAELRSLLLHARKLLLEKDPASVNRLVQLLVQHEPDPARVEQVKTSYRTIKSIRKEPFEGTAEPVAGGGFKVAPGRSNFDALQASFNEQLFHTDPTTGETLPDLQSEEFSDDRPFEVLTRQNLLAYVLDECGFALWLAAFVESAPS